MHQTLPSSSTLFRFGDVSTGEPHLYCAASLADRRSLSRPQSDPRETHLRMAIAVHLPRLTLLACSAAAMLLGFVALASAEGAASTSAAERMTIECAGRDLKVTALIEQHGETGDLPANLLGELGLMQLRARLACLAGDETRALAIYDDVLGAARLAARVWP